MPVSQARRSGRAELRAVRQFCGGGGEDRARSAGLDADGDHAGDDLADGRFGFVSSSNDGDFQRRVLNNGKLATSLHETCRG